MSRAFLTRIAWPVALGLLLALATIQYLHSQRLATALQELQAVESPATGQIAVVPRASSFANAVALAMPSVVKIYTLRVVPSARHPLLSDPIFRRLYNRNSNRNNTNSRDQIQRGLGSGVIVRSDGYILTNNHVIDKADRIQVMLSDGRERLAEVVGRDADTDLAVLKIDLEDIPAAHFAEPGSARIGDIVLAIGNPYGIGQTVTQGIVSATGRHGLQLNTYENYIQTDAAINQGNSGGALINTAGEVIGINSGLYSRSGGSTGIGFAIPVATALYVLEQIIEEGEVLRGWLGVSVENITPSMAEAFGLGIDRGLIVTDIARGGPAEQGGIRAGDILTHIDNRAIVNGNTSMHQIAQTRPGSKISIGLLRNGSAQSALVTIGRHPAPNRSQ